MKRVRMLLRVSSDQQLEADGDLSVQRKIVREYIDLHEEWLPDEKEYFEGSTSAYKNTSSDRRILQEVLRDAGNREFDVLVLYKDDRVGRLMWDTPMYIMELKKRGVDVFTVKDGCISPESDDIMGQMMLTFRYANAQKSSADTGMRVRDTAQKLVERGKFMGGTAPYGYRLEYSGEISKHGRALKHLVIDQEKAEVVRHIYELSLNKEYGSARIAKELNLDDRYKLLAPNDVWKEGTITSILTNPIYTGHTAYRRRERKNGRYHRLDSSDWILSVDPDERIVIIDDDTWNRTQDKRKRRGDKYAKDTGDEDAAVIRRNAGMLPLADVLYCGYCGGRMVNGSRYNYWQIKSTGERRTSKVAIYECRNARQGVPHDRTKQYRADRMEPVIFRAVAGYIDKLQEKESIFDEMQKNYDRERRQKETDLRKEKAELKKLSRNIDVMEGSIPSAMQGEYPLSLEELAALLRKQKEAYEKQQFLIREKEEKLAKTAVFCEDREAVGRNIPTWQDVFLNADPALKRVLVNKLIERIDVKEEEVSVRFRIGRSSFGAVTNER